MLEGDGGAGWVFFCPVMCGDTALLRIDPTHSEKGDPFCLPETDSLALQDVRGMVGFKALSCCRMTLRDRSLHALTPLSKLCC